MTASRSGERAAPLAAARSAKQQLDMQRRHASVRNTSGEATALRSRVACCGQKEHPQAAIRTFQNLPVWSRAANVMEIEAVRVSQHTVSHATPRVWRTTLYASGVEPTAGVASSSCQVKPQPTVSSRVKSCSSRSRLAPVLGLDEERTRPPANQEPSHHEGERQGAQRPQYLTLQPRSSGIPWRRSPAGPAPSERANSQGTGGSLTGVF